MIDEQRHLRSWIFGDMMLFTYSCPKTHHCTPLSSFTDCQSSGKRAISNHVSLHLHPQISHSSFTKRRMPVWTPGKELHDIARTTKTHETSPFLPLLWEITFSFHVCLACGMRCQQPAAQLLLPRHIDVQGTVRFLPMGHRWNMEFLPLFMLEPLILPFFQM